MKRSGRNAPWRLAAAPSVINSPSICAVPGAVLKPMCWWPSASHRPGSVSYTHLDVYKRQVEQLLEELPQLKSFATLSPIPGFADWLGKLDADAVEAIVREDKSRAKTRQRAGVPDGQRWVARLARAAQAKACLLYTSRCV